MPHRTPIATVTGLLLTVRQHRPRRHAARACPYAAWQPCDAWLARVRALLGLPIGQLPAPGRAAQRRLPWPGRYSSSRVFGPTAGRAILSGRARILASKWATRSDIVTTLPRRDILLHLAETTNFIQRSFYAHTVGIGLGASEPPDPPIDVKLCKADPFVPCDAGVDDMGEVRPPAWASPSVVGCERHDVDAEVVKVEQRARQVVR
ncbi:hypothetical protein B0O95_104105 [Mycetohabitans endofungorum]|uniref:Uncharacterized protein n=1 Tax=Mycetohabitans endofungorum TaxID=417203 RepID=A0A2P5KBY4_9BURK|nr:hypothetical protein B0O95_104105 [Mycetohabitans endofungorum]